MPAVPPLARTTLFNFSITACRHISAVLPLLESINAQIPNRYANIIHFHKTRKKRAVIIRHNNIIKDLVSIHTAFHRNARVIKHPQMQLFYSSLGGAQVAASATPEPGNYRMVTCEQLPVDPCGKPLRLNTNTAVKYRLLTVEGRQQTK